MYALLQMARRRAPLVVGGVLLAIALVYGIGGALLDNAQSLPPARVVIVGIAGLALIATGIIGRRADRSQTRRPSEPSGPG